MKNTVVTGRKGKLGPSAMTLAERIGGMPFYLAILLYGMPIDGDLTTGRLVLAGDIQDRLAATAATTGIAQSVYPALAWGGIYIFASMLLIRKSSMRQLAKMITGQWPLLALMLLSFFSMAWSADPLKVAVSSVHVLGATAVAMAAAIRCSAGPWSFIAALARCFGINLTVQLGAVLLAPSIGIASDGRWMGLTTHSNTLGALAFIAAWTGLASLVVGGVRRRFFIFMAMLVSGIVLIGSGSATSMLSAIISIGLLAFMRSSTKWPAVRRFQFVAGVSILVCSAIIAWGLFGSVVDDITGLLGKSDSFTGRDVIWAEALRLFTMHPVLGFGFDDHASIILNAGFNHTSFHNGYIDLAVSGGVAALILVSLSFILWLRKVVLLNRHWMMICTSLVAGLAIHNMMEASLFVSRNVLWQVMSVLVFCTVLLRSGAASAGFAPRCAASEITHV